MPQQVLNGHATDFSGSSADRTGVVHRPIIRYPGGIPSQNHRVKRGILLKLPIEQQIPRARRMYIAGHQVGIAPHQRLGVGKLGEAAIGSIPGLVRAGANAKQSSAERGERVDVLGDRVERRQHVERLISKPDLVMRVQRPAIAPPQQCSAIVNLLRKTGGRYIGRRIGERGEPNSKSIAVSGRVQAKKLWRAVAEEVARVGLEPEGNVGTYMFVLQSESLLPGFTGLTNCTTAPAPSGNTCALSPLIDTFSGSRRSPLARPKRAARCNLPSAGRVALICVIVRGSRRRQPV